MITARCLRHGQRAHEVAKVVGQRVELKAAAKVRHDSSVHLLAPLPSLIHCSAVPRWL